MPATMYGDRTKLMWCALEEMVSLIEHGKPNTNQLHCETP